MPNILKLLLSRKKYFLVSFWSFTSNLSAQFALTFQPESDNFLLKMEISI